MANIYSVQFDEVNDFFDLQDNAAWDVSIAGVSQGYIGWLEIDDNSGANFQYFFSSGAFNAPNSVNCYINESGQGADANKFKITTQAAGGTQDAVTTAQTFPTGKILYVAQFNSTNTRWEIVLCDEGGTAVRYTAAANVTNNVISSNWNLGRRQDANADRYYGGKVFNWAKFTGLLSNADVEALAADVLLYDRDLLDTVATAEIFFPMNEGAGTTITDDVLGLIGTGTGFSGSQWILEGSAGGTTSVTAGTAIPTQTEDDIIAGGKTITLTLIDDTFVTGSTSLDGIASGSDSDIAASGTNWDSLIKTALDNTDVVLSVGDTVATITLPSFATYDVPATETITWTIPASSLTTSSVDVISSPTFTVTHVVVLPIITTEPLKNNTGQLLFSETGVIAEVYNISNGTLVVRKTGLTSDVSGIVTFSDALMSATTEYRVIITLSDNAEGLSRITTT